jgi:hypothetical protein
MNTSSYNVPRTKPITFNAFIVLLVILFVSSQFIVSMLVGWNACKHTVKVHCTHAGVGYAKGKPSLVFEVTSSHTQKIMHVSRMFWGATTGITIVKFDEAAKPH